MRGKVLFLSVAHAVTHPVKRQHLLHLGKRSGSASRKFASARYDTRERKNERGVPRIN